MNKLTFFILTHDYFGTVDDPKDEWMACKLYNAQSCIFFRSYNDLLYEFNRRDKISSAIDYVCDIIGDGMQHVLLMREEAGDIFKDLFEGNRSLDSVELENSVFFSIIKVQIDIDWVINAINNQVTHIKKEHIVSITDYYWQDGNPIQIDFLENK